MLLVKIEDVKISEARIRKAFPEVDIEELAESIEHYGLMHAIVTRPDGVTLIAGERRLRAIKILHEWKKPFKYNGKEVEPGYIPVVSLAEFTKLGYIEAELEENLKRLNLTWQEKSNAIAALHELGVSEAKERGETHTFTDTARELSGREDVGGRYTTDVTRSILLTAWADDPEVAKAKTEKDALKIIEKKARAKHREVLAKEYNLSEEDTPHELYQGDLRNVMITLEEGKFDCIIADPPFGISSDKFENQNAIQHDYDDSEEYSTEIYEFIAEIGWTKTKVEAHIYIFVDINMFGHVYSIFEEIGWKVWNTPLIWYRQGGIGILPRPDHGPRRTYEAILYAIKGDKQVITRGAPDVLAVHHDTSIERGAHKPPLLYHELMIRSCLPGSYILDPCCGAGPIFPAANKASMYATGIEIDPIGYSISFERLSQGIEDEPNTEA